MIGKALKNYWKANVTHFYWSPPPPGTRIEPLFPYIIFKSLSRGFHRLGVYTYNNFISRTTFGLYPKEWNPRVHGPYVHHRYYGTNTDVPLMDVKLRDVAAYIGRRDKSPRAIWREFMRNFYWVLYHYGTGPAYQNPLNAVARFLVLFVVLPCCLWRMALDMQGHFRRALYHW